MAFHADAPGGGTGRPYEKPRLKVFDVNALLGLLAPEMGSTDPGAEGRPLSDIERLKRFPVSR